MDTKRNVGACWKTSDGEIRCPLKERGNCWESPSGQIQCDGDALTGNDDQNSSGDPSTTTSSASTPDIITASTAASSQTPTADSNTDSNTDSTYTGPTTDPITGDDSTTSDSTTTCVHTSDGFLECGSVMFKRVSIDKRDLEPAYLACTRGPDGVVDCHAPIPANPGNGSLELDERNAVPGEPTLRSRMDLDKH